MAPSQIDYAHKPGNYTKDTYKDTIPNIYTYKL